MKREFTPELLPQINAEKGCLHVLSTFFGVNPVREIIFIAH
jgi:hypothetical protein